MGILVSQPLTLFGILMEVYLSLINILKQAGAQQMLWYDKSAFQLSAASHVQG